MLEEWCIHYLESKSFRTGGGVGREGGSRLDKESWIKEAENELDLLFETTTPATRFQSERINNPVMESLLAIEWRYS